MALVVKFSTLAGGVFIEENGSDARSDADRCFRFDNAGRAEWATFGDLVRDASRARWYGFSVPESQFIFC